MRRALAAAEERGTYRVKGRLRSDLRVIVRQVRDEPVFLLAFVERSLVVCVAAYLHISLTVFV